MGVRLVIIILVGILLLNGVYASEVNITSVTKQSSETDAGYDEVIRVNSVRLEGATNKVIKRNGCVSGTDTYQGYLISPSKVPETYNYVIGFLKN